MLAAHARLDLVDLGMNPRDSADRVASIVPSLVDQHVPGIHGVMAIVGSVQHPTLVFYFALTGLTATCTVT